MFGFGMPEMIMIAVIMGIVVVIVVSRKGGGQRTNNDYGYSNTPETPGNVSQIGRAVGITKNAGTVLLANAPVFVIVYILFMLPTYYLPYLGSNFSVLNALGAATGQGLNPAFYWHLIALLMLIVAAWFRGTFIGKKWLVIFPILATVFDLTPGLSAIPLIPTVMHLLAIILGVVGVSAVAISQSGSVSNP